MKWNILLATLVLGLMSSQSYAAGLLDQMLGSGCGATTSCCQTPACCVPKARCCMPKPRCYAPPAATCCAPEPACCAPEPHCAAPVDCGCHSAPVCKPRFATPLRDALHNVFHSGRRTLCGHLCGHGCGHTCAPEPACCAPEPACCAPEPICAAPCAPEPACGCPSAAACGCDAAPACHQHCRRSCSPIRDAVARLFSSHRGCHSGCGVDACGCGVGCGYDLQGPPAAPTEADMDDMPPAPVPDDAMTFVPARRRVATSR